MRTSSIIAGLLALLAVGCAGDPDHAALSFDMADHASVSRGDWEVAIAGCEGVDLDHAELFVCEGEEEVLGALVHDESGDVICVDALGLLLRDVHERPDMADPSPQPSRGRVYSATGVVIGSGDMEDPTPTPTILHQLADPVPTPVVVPDLADPTPTPTVDAHPNEEDPTPTPTME